MLFTAYALLTNILLQIYAPPHENKKAQINNNSTFNIFWFFSITFIEQCTLF